MKEPGITNDTDIVVSHDTENASELLQMDNKGCVLFNFWGTDLPGLVTSASEAKVKSLDQKRVLYQSDNSSFMVERLLPLFERFEGIETSYKDDTLDIAYKQLWGLMNDYLDRVESEDNNYMDVFASFLKQMHVLIGHIDNMRSQRMIGQKTLLFYLSQ